MGNPIAARKNGNFKAVSTAPSFNKTPVGNSTPPLPYGTTQDLGSSVSVVPTVKLNGDPAYVLNQTTQPSCKGDNPGVANGKVTPTKASTTVRMGGKPIVRHGDPCTMNGGNNPGVYITTQTPSATPPKHAAGNADPRTKPQTPLEKSFLDKAMDAARSAGQTYKDKVSESLHDFAGSAMDKGGTIAAAGSATAAVGGAMVATGIGAAPGAVMVAGGGATAAVGGGVSAVGGIAETAATGLDAAADFATSGKLPNVVGMATAYAERMVMSKLDKLTKLIPGKGKKSSKPQAKKETEKEKSQAKAAEPKPAGNGTTIVGEGKDPGDCGIKPYKDQKCPKGQQAHHIVPDYALRYGNRKNSEARIPGMPSLDDGPSICLSGGSRTKDSAHNQAHEGTAPKIMAAGQRTDNGAVGVAPIGEIIDISVEEVGKVKPHCQEEIKRKVDDAFKGVDRNKYGRTTQQLPKEGSEAHAKLKDGNVHTDTGRTINRKPPKGKR